MHFLSMFIYVSFRTARHFPVIVTHFGSQHFPCMLSSLSKPASLMQPASRSAMARIEPEGSEGRSISLSSSRWKETNKESVIWTVWHASVDSRHILGTLLCKQVRRVRNYSQHQTLLSMQPTPKATQHMGKQTIRLQYFQTQIH